MRVSNLLCSALLALAVPLSAYAAETLTPPTGPAVLTVTGDIAATTAGGKAEFDIDSLQALGTVTVETSTIWTDGVIAFRGVPLNQFLEKLGAKGTTLRIWALNDYTVDVPITDAVEGGPILAFEANGAPLSVRDKGPIWLLYPYDSNAEYQTEVIYARSIWQIDRMELVD